MSDEPSAHDEIEMLRERASALEAIRVALDDAHGVLDILLGAADPEVARQTLSDRYGLIGVQADVVMNLQFRRATKSNRGKIQHEIEELQQQLDRLLEQTQGSDANE